MLEKWLPHFRFIINKPVFFTSLVCIAAIVGLCLFYPSLAFKGLSGAQLLITDNLGWFFILAANIILVFGLYLAFSKYGSIRLGGEKATPEFSRISWFAMLFSAGMGIGIMFFSVAEPVSHFSNPPQETINAPARAIQAMKFTSLHWGLHAWGIYSLVGLALAFFSFNRKLPLTFRSLFYPFLGERIHGWWGHAIDIFSILATIFGLSTSLGLGVQQMNAGLNFLFGWEISMTTQSWIILIVTSIATLSVVSGLDKGIKFLSNGNMIMAFTLMLLVFVLGPTIFLLKSYVQNAGAYLSGLIEMSLWNDSYQNSGWQNDWTVFYWAWWIAWSPFVGSFIARISKGRTIREFVLGVLLVPAMITLLWMTIFGGTALHFILEGDHTMIQAVQENISTALFVFFENFPMTMLLSIIAILLVAFFFITSSDSGSLVIDNIASGSAPYTPPLQRVCWAFLQAVIAISLLLGGGLEALQAAVIIAGLPFTVIILLMCYSLRQGLQEEYQYEEKKKRGHQEKNYREVIQEILKENP